MSIFGICFILYFLKLSACHGFLVSGVDQFLSDRKSADFPRGGALVPYQEADQTLFIFYYHSQL